MLNNTRFSKEKELFILDEYNKGRTTTDIAKELKTFNTSIRRVLVRNNITLISTADRLRKVKSIPFNESNESNYWLGYLIADGCIWKNKKAIGLFSIDYEVLEKFKKFLNYPVNINSELQKKYNSLCYNIRFTDYDSLKYLINLGFTPNKSHDFELKNKELNWNILRGYFDGDGSFVVINKNSGRGDIVFTSAGDLFFKQIQNFLLNFNINCKISQRKNTNFELRINRKIDVKLFFNYLYNNADIFLTRKYEKFGSYYHENDSILSH